MFNKLFMSIFPLFTFFLSLFRLPMETNGWGTNQGWGLGSGGLNFGDKMQWKTDDSEKQWKLPENKELASIFNIKTFSIKYHFGTGKVFESKVNPSDKFGETMTVSPILFDLPKPGVMKEDQKEPKEIHGEETEIDVDPVGSTGEENDEILFNKRARLLEYRKNKETKEKENVEIGLDDLHFNKSGDFYRLVMRRNTTQLCMNTRVVKGMRPMQVGNGKYIRYLHPSENGVVTVRTLQFESKEVAEELLNIWLKAIDEIQKA